MPTKYDFFEFIYERQLIWYKRFILNEYPPWTSDPILKKYKIINMYRELDKCTKYIIKKLKGIKNRGKILINIIFYRFFNLYHLYEYLKIYPFEKIEKERLLHNFERIKKQGKPIFNNAYLISSGKKGQQKHISVLRVLEKINLKELIKKLDNAKIPQESLNILQEIPMVGPFLACEIWTDLTYFNFFNQKWDDNDFVNIGPGAKWGLEILYGKLSNSKLNKKLHNLHKIQKDILPTINKKLRKKLTWENIAYKRAYSNVPFLSITNIEGALCEFRKYWRLKKGMGKKRYYKYGEIKKI